LLPPVVAHSPPSGSVSVDTPGLGLGLLSVVWDGGGGLGRPPSMDTVSPAVCGLTRVNSSYPPVRGTVGHFGQVLIPPALATINSPHSTQIAGVVLGRRSGSISTACFARSGWT